MRIKLFLPAVLALAVVPAAAQWDLFPPGQRSYFEYEAPDGVRVDLVLIDSVVQSSGAERYLYNKRRLRENALGNCASHGLVELSMYCSSLNYLLDMSLVMDSLVERNDTVFFSLDESTTPFFFLPKANVGQSWTVTSTYPGNQSSDILITCSAMTEASAFGVMDSVKTFEVDVIGTNEPIEGLQIQLSKTYGLLQFIPFRFFLVHPVGMAIPFLQLNGLERNGDAMGYGQPSFDDYFHLAPGDILLWENLVHPGWITDPPYYTYYRDSITDALHTPDSVVYTYDRIILNADQTVDVEYGQVRRHLKSAYVDYIEASPNDLAPGNLADEVYSDIWAVWPFQLAVSPGVMDPMTILTYAQEQFFLGEEECAIYGAFDVNYTVQLNTRVGLAGNWSWLNPSNYYSIVIASRVGGFQDGDISLGIGHTRHPQVGLHIRPNPASDRIFLHGPWPMEAPYSIVDGTGRVVQTGNTGTSGIAVGALPKGIYVMRVAGRAGAVAARFVKE